MTNAVAIAQSGSVGTIQGFKNRIINGTMSIWQRGTSFPNRNTNTYACDRFSLNTGNSTGGRVTLTQSTDVPVGSGLPYSLILQTATVSSSMAASEFWTIYQLVEANNCSDLAYGTALAKTITLSYWIKCSLAGTYCGNIIQRQASTQRCFPWLISVSAPNTWQQVVVVIPGDTGGSIPVNNGAGFEINFAYIGIGSNYQSGTVNTWNVNASGTQYLPSGQTYPNVLSNTNNTVQIAGVQLEVGSTPTSQEIRPFGLELHLCQRYYEKSYDYFTVPGTPGSWATTVSVSFPKSAGTYFDYRVMFKVEKRANSGTMVWYNSVTGSNTTMRCEQVAVNNVDFNYTAGTFYVWTHGAMYRMVATASTGLTDSQAYATGNWTVESEL